jgi:DUF4097 and DUF4098 domain-containing protein YvlB
MASPINPGTPALPPPPGGQLPPGPPQPPAGGPPFPPPVRYRRRSIFSGLLLVIVGALLLVATLHPGFSLGYVVTHFWPVIFIIWGISKLIDRYALAQPGGGAPVSLVTGGEVALILFLIVLVGFVAIIGWVRNRHGLWDIGPFTAQYSQTQQAESGPLRQGSWVTINTTNGDISVQPASGDTIHASANETARAATEQEARDRLKTMNIVAQRTEFGLSGDGYSVHPVNANGNISVDLDVQTPKAAPVTAKTGRGNVTVAGIQGPTDAATRNGDLQIHDVGANVTANIQNGEAHIRNIAGSVDFTGRGGGDVEIADVQGAANLQGNVFGDIDLRDVAKGVHYTSPRSDVQLEALPGELKIDTSEIALSRATGPISVTAHNQDMQLDDVRGPLNLTETRGNISVTLATPPKAPITISNDSGDVILTLPPQSSFTIYAESNSGNISNDFGAVPNSDDRGPHVLNATYGAAGPTIHIVTKYGDIHINKTQ